MADPTIDSLAKSAKPEPSIGRVLGLFAKVWDPGKVKTRLARTVGAQKAAEIYRELLVLHLNRFSGTSEKRVVAYSPATDESRIRFKELAHRIDPEPIWEFVPQVESDLGTRMSRFFEQQFDAGRQRIVVIGSDAPRLNRELIEDSFEALKTSDVVFGPSNDGGYYLVGLRVMAKQIFQGIDWSTEKVLNQSLAKCEANGLSVTQLRPLTDIDDEEDLVNEMDLLQESSDVLIKRFLKNAASILGSDES